jgi:tRNA pseudouridine38-40 synthase
MKQVDDGFNPRYAQQRIYRYYLQKNNYEIHSIQRTASFFEGTHNFSNFARIEPHRNPVRTIDTIDISTKGECIIFDFYAQTYLWHQIRRIISTIEQVEKNKITIEQIISALNNPNDKVDFGIVRPESLILLDVLYNFDFNIDDFWIKKKDEIEKKLISDIKCLSS